MLSLGAASCCYRLIDDSLHKYGDVHACALSFTNVTFPSMFGCYMQYTFVFRLRKVNMTVADSLTHCRQLCGSQAT